MKTLRRSLCILSLPVLFAALLVACGDNTDSSSPSLPGLADLPRSPQPGEVLQWVKIYEAKTCPYPECPASQGFEVQKSGQLTYGSGTQKQLSQQDLTMLEDHMVQVLDQDLSPASTCNTVTVLAGMSSMSVDLYFQGNVLSRIYQLDTQTAQECWHGDYGKAKNLADLVDQFATQYSVTPVSESP